MAAPQPERRSDLSNLARQLAWNLDQIKDPARKLVAFREATQAVLGHWLPSDDDPSQGEAAPPAPPTDTPVPPVLSGKQLG